MVDHSASELVIMASFESFAKHTKATAARMLVVAFKAKQRDYSNLCAIKSQAIARETQNASEMQKPIFLTEGKVDRSAPSKVIFVSVSF